MTGLVMWHMQGRLLQLKSKVSGVSRKIVDEARKGDWGQDVLHLDYHTERFSCC